MIHHFSNEKILKEKLSNQIRKCKDSRLFKKFIELNMENIGSNFENEKSNYQDEDFKVIDPLCLNKLIEIFD
jgi:hypothetical protein